MGDVNAITITGSVGRDAETRHTSGGNSVTSFSVANSQYRGGENVTVWYTVQLWGKRGESLAQYITKGTKVAVTGRHTVREYEKREGGTGYANEIDANDVALIGSKGGDSDGAPRERPASAGRRNAPQAIDDGDESIPF